MWARINNGAVAELTDQDPNGRFHPSIHWEPCPADAEIGWSYDGQAFAPPHPEPIEDLADEKRREMDSARDQAFAAGLPYDIAGTPDVVQTRPQDQINLLGLSSKAQRLLAAGDTETLIPFRGLSNVNHGLTAQQMDDLTMAALAHIESIYQRSWDRKDAIDAAEEAGDRAAIEAVTW